MAASGANAVGPGAGNRRAVVADSRLGPGDEELLHFSTPTSGLSDALRDAGFVRGPAPAGVDGRWVRFARGSVQCVDFLSAPPESAVVRLRTFAPQGRAPEAERGEAVAPVLDLLAAASRGRRLDLRPATARRPTVTGRAHVPLPRHRRRPCVVALSGLDGAGKSTQAKALCEIFEWLGIEASTFWLPLGHSSLQRRIRRTLSSFRPRASSNERTLPTLTTSSKADALGPGRRIRERSSLAAKLWVTFVALTYGLSYRRALRHRRAGEVVIFDRYLADAVAQIRYFYRQHPRVGFVRALLTTLAPRAHAYLLDVDPALALSRKQEQYDLDQLTRQAHLLRSEALAQGVNVVAGTRPADEIAAEIAADVWACLSPSSP